MAQGEYGVATRKEVFAWGLYDWANSAYSALSITILVFYIKSVVFPGPVGNLVWGYGIGLSMFLAALLSPILGALADARATKRLWLAGTALPGALAATAFYFVPPERPWVFAGLFFVVSLLFELSFGFYNGFLPEIADDSSMNRVSAFGFGMGYIGGGLALLVAVLLLGFGEQIGLPAGTELTKDYNYCREGTFEVAVPEGTYDVVVTLGDPAQRRDEMQVSLEGRPLETISTHAAQIAVRHYRTTVTDGTLTVGLKDLGGNDPFVAINGLQISGMKGSTIPPFDFGTPASAAAPGHIWVTEHDTFRARRVIDEKKLQPADRAQDAVESENPVVPKVLRFGWRSGQIGSRDGVTAARLRCGLLIMGLWWGLFSLPAVWILRDRSAPQCRPEPVYRAAVGAVRQVAGTLRNIHTVRTLALFLLGFLLYNEGIQTVISQASVFAIEALRISAEELILVVLMIQFAAMPGAWMVGRLADRIGPKRALIACLAVWVSLLVAAFFVTTSRQFWIMGAVLALVMGGTQSVSRSVMGLMTPQGRTAEFFGFFNFSGKATSFFGPIFFSSILVASGSAHWAILSLLAFFLVGWFVVARLNIAQGQAEAARA